MATSGSHGEPFVPAGPKHNLNYEPDTFDLKPILAVPVVVIVTSVAAFVVTWVIFANIFDPRINVPAPEVEIAKERAEAPMNERFARISSNDPKAEIEEPRLEGIQQTGSVKRADGYEVTAEMTSAQPIKSPANTVRYHPEDLRAERWSELMTYGQNKEVGTVRIPVDKAIELLTSGDLKLPSTKERVGVHAPVDRPKESNGGTGAKPEVKLPEAKQPEKK